MSHEFICFFFSRHSLTDAFQSSSTRSRLGRRKKLSSQSDVDGLEGALSECCCDLSCLSPCRPIVQQTSPCDATHFQGDSQSNNVILWKNRHKTNILIIWLVERGQIFQSPKRRSLIAASSNSSCSFSTSPVAIRQRKTSLSFTSPCRSFPG